LEFGLFKVGEMVLLNKKKVNARKMHVPYYKQKNKNKKSRYKESAFITMIKQRRALSALQMQKRRNKKKSP